MSRNHKGKYLIRESIVITKEYHENKVVMKHMWTKGFDYELIEGEGYIKLASNEGSVSYVENLKKSVLENFEMIV